MPAPCGAEADGRLQPTARRGQHRQPHVGFIRGDDVESCSEGSIWRALAARSALYSAASTAREPELGSRPRCVPVASAGDMQTFLVENSMDG